MAVTPMMQQYFAVKETVRDCILMYRLGDFYEMFYEDAQTASRELDLVLTGRACGEGDRAPMCGVPFHAVDSYITRLIQKGYRVAICEQTEDPATAVGIVKRDIVRIVSPGTVTEGDYLSDGKNNFLGCIMTSGIGIGLAFADISTGEMFARSLPAQATSEVLSVLSSYAPSELIYREDTPKEICDFCRSKLNSMLTPRSEEDFGAQATLPAVEAQFNAGWRDKYGFTVNDPSAQAVGALLCYISQTQKTDIKYMQSLTHITGDKVMQLDYYSRRNLELTQTMRLKEKKGSLLWVIDKTVTSAGARLIRMWLERPLTDSKQIRRRQDAVSELFNDAVRRTDITDGLHRIIDIERFLTKAVYNTASARDMKAFAASLSHIPYIIDRLSSFTSPELTEIADTAETFDALVKDIDGMFVDEPPAFIRDGGFIRDGYDEQLDRCREISNSGQSWMKNLEEKEKEATGIKNLRIGYNRVFGYYIEVSKGQTGLVPATYNRLQTLVNCERYSIPSMKELEREMVSGEEKAKAIELMYFEKLRQKVLSVMTQLRYTAGVLAKLDVYCSFAALAAENNYTRPEVDDSDVIQIKDGRHPVVEKFMKDTYFVPNDTDLDCASKRVMVITGPNMAGKSTYMRQVAVLVLLAQTGSFIPAREARIGTVDRIFTRVGASDDLASGNSTFMLEMVEVASILENSTRSSLIIYDEIGRGTSTFDGMSIARAVVEFTAKKIGAKTLFATHYHELTTLEGEAEGVLNYNIAAKKRGDDIVFLRKILRGCSDDSYGIEVAKLAGVPKQVISRAKEILASLVSGPVQLHAPIHTEEKKEPEISFENISEKSVTDKIRSVDINALTPFEAISLLYEFKKTLGR